MFVPVATSEHITTVASLAREIWTEHYSPLIGTEQVEYMLARFQSHQAIQEQINSGALYYLITNDGAYAGYVAVQPKGRDLFLSKIYVRSSLRRRGIGRKALQFTELLAQRQGFERITLTVNRNNTDSIRMYERCGFRNAGVIVQDIGGGFVMDDYRMEKTIA
jgi:ribosomal protein S18 acetylase RimI-like enzyme